MARCASCKSIANISEVAPASIAAKVRAIGISPFATTRSARLATGDPRKSLEERYKDHDGYVKEVTKAAEKLEKKRLLLPSDVKRYIDEADASHVLR